MIDAISKFICQISCRHEYKIRVTPNTGHIEVCKYCQDIKVHYDNKG